MHRRTFVGSSVAVAAAATAHDAIARLLRILPGRLVITPADALAPTPPAILLGAVPHLTVWHGSALVLRVGAPDAPAATFSISASPAPARGTLSIDAKSGLLRYAPAPTDLDEFDLTISSSSGRSQTIRVLPLPVLPPSAEVVQTTPPFDLTTQPNPDACDDLSANPYGTCPDAASKAYQTYTIRVASQSVWFNDGEYTPRDIMITGKRVNLEKSIGNVIAALDAKPDIRSLTICADTVVVRDAFSFPLTALTLYARRLVFEDPDPSKASYINLTPERLTGPDQAAKPTTGYNAAKVLIYARECVAPPGPQARIVARGGDKDGSPGGRGAIVVSTSSAVRSLCEVGSGAGASIASGVVSILTDTYELAWLHPAALRAVINFTNDIYLNGNLRDAWQILTFYDSLVADANEGQLTPEFVDAYQQMHLEIASLLSRLNGRRDYFGNPAGWVPLLSLTTNVALYKQEVDAAVPLLLLADWVQFFADKQQAQMEALADAQRAIVVRQSQSLDTLSVSVNLIPVLEAQVAQLTDSIAAYKKRIADREDELRQAAEPPIWKRALGVLGTACEFIPVFQPALGAVGLGLTAISQFDENDPLATVGKLADVASNVSESLPATHANSADFLSTANAAGKRPLDYIKGLTKLSADTVPKIQQLANLNWSQSSDSTNMDAELAHLRATDAGLNDLVDGLQALNQQKQQICNQVTQTVTQIASLTQDIAADGLAIDRLESQAVEQAIAYDQAAVEAIQDAGRRARTRLLEYHYYVQKAFEYGVLRPYPNPLDTAAVFDRVRKMIVDLNGDFAQLQAQYSTLAALFQTALQDIRAALAAEPANNLNYQQRTPPLPIPLLDSQVAALNAKDSNGHYISTSSGVSVDLMDYGLPEEERHRIVSIYVAQIDVSADAAAQRLSIVVEHSGSSVLRADGRLFAFRHYKDDRYAVVPLFWQTEVPIVGGRASAPTPDTISPDSIALLNWMIPPGAPGLGNTFLVRPGVYGGTLRIKAIRSPDGSSVDIKRLVLALEDEFIGPPSADHWLDVTASNGLTPLIRLAVNDQDQRPGRTRFQRLIGAGSKLTLTAPTRYGRRPFQHWVERKGQWGSQHVIVQALPTYSLTVGSALRLEAVYGPLA